MITPILYVLQGIRAGTLSGLIGIGGGVIIVPALVFVFGLTQHAAQGTMLALLVPPIGILSAWPYWKQGDVDIRIAVFICLGFLLGSLLGTRVATQLPNLLLGRIFGGAMVLIGPQNGAGPVGLTRQRSPQRTARPAPAVCCA
ncbi:sulfite exporter TauE/SafE family protein [Synechococcus sp. Cruz-9H2]|nr:sulfite exporter TauE/SafE family protein [Synechococcus sp. Cruz-9H2]MCP9845207.1 sulfite exporter TauE/SafE family protein [Synechococcus sp. Edmonson 11F2]MCP9857378.1 sulfite exporter TauE/SafE family protein [Synechococcus sp. Cruz-9C9]MCP9864623.1 sulfite exporter TauE/SafE family protein [Synechococcus sp. Cruz-7E5]MCP9871893.1 sulfite exporter TauE/SafE family protein [Synechococcus sp. Cruz-7B9]